jgi:NDP-4-keto-2,6-dideoxyhexose 3-C-methyltransferase
MSMIKQCRICGNSHLESILHLGNQHLTGVFPQTKDEPITSGPLELVKCMGEDHCGLLQLGQSFDLNEMYGENYGYRSGLNPTMVRHLGNITRGILERVTLAPDDLVIDIGSNDGTLLKSYPAGPYTLTGVDPTGVKFKEHYPAHIQLIPDFFSAALIRERFGNRKAKIITSIAMFYDLENPLDFMRDVASVLADDGVWVFEQSYMPAMLARNAYDTVCHEHLEYYGLSQIRWMADRADLEIVDLKLSNVNGGSFRVTVAKRSELVKAHSMVQRVLRDEAQRGMNTLQPYLVFADRVAKLKDELLTFFENSRKSGASILGYGASTKGNVLLQYCGLTSADIACIAEVNPYKYGRFTPGTLIPIVSETEAHVMHPDYLLVLPWHFRRFIIQKEDSYLSTGGRLLFPLPKLEAVGK